MRTLILIILITTSLHAETHVRAFDSTITLVTNQTFNPKVFTMSNCILFYESEGMSGDEAAKTCIEFKGDEL